MDKVDQEQTPKQIKEASRAMQELWRKWKEEDGVKKRS